LLTPDWSGFWLCQKGRRTEPLAGHGKLDSRKVTGSCLFIEENEMRNKFIESMVSFC